MPALGIVILPSARMGLLLGALHLGAGALAVLLLPVWATAAFIAAVAWSFKRCVVEFALLRGRNAIAAINVTSEGKVMARTQGDDAWGECELLPSSFVSWHLTILNLRARGARRVRHVVLCCGNVDANDLRRLRVWLRWAAAASISGNS